MTAEAIIVERTCEWCGAELPQGARSRMRYCSKPHALMANRVKAAEAPRPVVVPLDVKAERVRRATGEAATWSDRGACIELDWHRMDLDEQLATCARCPVVRECRAYADELEQGTALKTVESFPVYGGETGADRVARRTGVEKGKPGKPGRPPRVAG